MNPQRKPLSASRWWVATFFSIVSDISNTIAQFMPMKAIFILALDDLPSFFPRFLIELGVTWSAFILVGVAAVFGVVAAVTKRIVVSMAGPGDTHPRTANGEKKNREKPPLTFHEFTSQMLAVILIIGGSLVSIAFTASVVLWLILTGTVLAVQIKRRPRRPPYHTAPLEFQAEFKKFITRSNLWSTVAAALLTLLVAYPELGITGILIGAILLRRLQTAVGELGLRLIRDKKPKVLYSRGLQLDETPSTSLPLSAPLDFIATPSGKRLLVESLRHLDLDDTRWRVVGQPDRNQVSIIAERSIGGDTMLLRIFATDKTALRDLEFDLRSQTGDYSPFLSSQAHSTVIAGLPGIVVRFPRGAAPQPQTPVTALEAIEWQILWETRCLTTRDRRKLGLHLEALQAVSPVPDPEKFLLPHLRVIAAINGPHQKAAWQLIRVMPQLRERFLSGPDIYSTGGPLSPVNLLRLASGGIEPLNFSTARVAKPGDSWSESPHFENYIEKSLDTLPSLRAWSVPEATMRAKITALGRYAVSRNFSVLETKLEQGLEAFYALDNKPVPQH